MDSPHEHLRGSIRELAALSALASSGTIRPPGEVVDRFVELLARALDLDVAFVQVDDAGGALPLAASFVGGVRGTPETTRTVAATVDARLSSTVAAAPETIRTVPIAHPVYGDALRLAAVHLPSGGGVVAAASRRAAFPSADEIPILVSAVHQLEHWERIIQLERAAARTQSQLAERESTRLQLEDENAYLRQEVEEALSIRGIVGQSAALRDLLSEIELVAPTNATVLLLGESGTGKEVFAREIHRRSRRAGRPLINVNCSAIPRDMFESEFFGHVRGAFTGAHRDRPGRFKLADQGTLFLDEVGDIPLDLQPKLLRVLQEGQYESVGGDTTHKVDIRVIAATNRSLTVAVEEGRFREDLYYRLHVFPLRTPPLRDRKEDIALLANHFIDRVAKQIGKVPPPELSERQLALLIRYDWPGNVRELENVIERAVILSRGRELRLEHVIGGRDRPRTGSSDSSDAFEAVASGTRLAATTASSAPPPSASELPAQEVVPADEWRRRERANLVAALARSSGRIYGAGGAAELLGVKPSTLQSRLRAFGIRARERGSG